MDETTALRVKKVLVNRNFPDSGESYIHYIVHIATQSCNLRCGNISGTLFSQRYKITTLYNVVFTLCVCWGAFPRISTVKGIHRIVFDIFF